MTGDYRFLRKEKSTFINIVRTEMQRQGGSNLPPEFINKVAFDSGVSPHTLRAWLYGDTLQPQAITLQFVLEALACKLQVVREDGTIPRGQARK
jgi:hypothetical protein